MVNSQLTATHLSYFKQPKMKHLLIFSILIAICNIHAFGQNITFTFLGENSFNQAPLNVDKVQIDNNTNGTDTLVFGNIFSILNTSIEISELESNRDIVIYPNPFDHSVNIVFHSTVYEPAQINVYDVNGRKIAHWDNYINIGENKLLLKSGVKGMLFLTISSPNLQLNAKLICNKASNISELKLIGNSYTPLSNNELKSGQNLYNNFEYTIGDSLSFTGYTEDIVSDVLHDKPNGNKTYTLFFDVSNYLPVADFDVSSQILVEGSNTSFFDRSTNNPTSWTWDFGDGSTSSIQNPSHTYLSAGTYTITLISGNNYGSDTLIVNDYITVYSLIPAAGFAANKTTINQGDEIIFSDQSTNSPTSWEWDFGDGNTSTSQNPAHTYLAPGNYTIKLTAGNSYGSDTIIKEDYITVYPSNVPLADFSANKTTINESDAVTFSDQSTNTPTSWEWDFGDGNISNTQNPTHTYFSPGIYTVKLTVVNSFGSDSRTKQNYITVNSLAPIAGFSANTSTINQGDDITFSDQSGNSPTSWKWDFGDGSTSTIQNPSHTYMTAGVFSVNLIAFNTFGSDTIVKENFIIVNSSVPVADFSTNTTAINQGDEITFSDQSINTPTAWEWDFGDGSTSSVQNPSHTYSTSGLYSIKLIVINTYGSDTIVKENFITVNSSVPVANFSANTTAINQGDEIIFSDQSANTPTAWEWDFGDGETSTIQNPTHTYSTSGSYSIQLIAVNTFGSDTIVRENFISVNSSVPVAEFSANTTAINQGDEIIFSDQSANSPTSWEWDFGDGEISTIQNPSHTYSTSGSYSVQLIAVNTFGSDTIVKENFISVNTSVPVADFSANTTAINQGDEIIFSDQSANSPTSWEWDFGDGEISTIQNPSHTYSTSGSYSVQLIAVNTFGSDTIVKENFITVGSSVPVADFSANKTTINQGDEIIFSDQSANSPTSWKWDFGDGDTSAVQDPSHIYSTSGSYSVQLIAVNTFGSDTIVKENFITVNSSVPDAAFSANKTTINQGDEIIFSDQSTNSPTLWNWDFGDGNTSTIQNPSHIYSTAGIFAVQFITTNAFGSDTIIKQDYIEVNSSVPVAGFAANTTTIDQGDEIIFSDQSTNFPTSWKWDFGDGETSVVQNPSHTYLLPGTYTVKLIAWNSYGSDTIAKENFVTINSLVPVAEFSANATTINQGNTIVFSDQSVNSPTSWEWDFGDGNTSDVQNPSHIYLTEGFYAVTLIAINSFGSDTIIKDDYITVIDSSVPVAAFSANQTTIDEGEDVIFSDESTNNPTAWSWYFGDGSTSTTQNPSHTFSTAGTYTVKLTASNSFGSDSIVKIDFITVIDPIPPVALFSANTTIISQGDDITFSDESTFNPTAWEWDFGDGETSNLQNPTHTYLTAGTFTVKLTASNSFGSDILVKEDLITVNSSVPVAAFSANTTVINQSDAITFSDQSTNNPTSWTWDFGDGSTSNVQNPSHNYMTAGVFSVQLIAINSFGSDTILKQNFITVNSLAPVAAFTANKTTISQGDAISFSDQSTNAPTSWTWDFGDGSTSTNQNPSHTFLTAGTFTVKLTISNSFGSDILVKENLITVNSSVPVAAFAANKTTIKQGDAISFSDQSTNLPTSWEWDFGDGVTSSVQNPSHTFSTAGTFTVKLTVSNSFGSDILVKENLVTVNSSVPVAAFSANKTTIKQGDAITFTDQSTNLPTSWEWDFGDGIMSNVQNPSHTFLTAGTFSVKLTVSNSFGSDIIVKENLITVNSSVPLAAFSANKTTIKQGDAITFTDQSTNLPTSWEWDFGDGNSSTVQNPNHTFLAAGTFSVKLVASNSFGSDSLIKQSYITVNSSVPVAAFTANKTTVNQGDEIVFSDQSTNLPTSWLWDFGDGSTSTLQNPSHTFLTAGIYTVELTVSNNFGSDSQIKQSYVVVNSLVPVAAFSANKTTIKQGDNIIFSDQSTNSPTSWLWDFGDGETSSLQNPSHKYLTAGIYTVRLKISNSFGLDSLTKENYITVNSLVPEVAFSANKTIIDQADEIIFSDQSTNSPTSWEWDFGDESTSNVQNPSHTYLTAGTYTVKLTVSNSFGSDTIVKENFITVNSLVPIAAFSATATLIDQGDEINFSDQSTNSPTSWEWDFGDGETSTSQNPSHIYMTAGTFSVKLTISNSYGADTIVKQDFITVNSLVPVAAFSADSTTIYAGDTINFSDLSTNTQPYGFGILVMEIQVVFSIHLTFIQLRACIPCNWYQSTVLVLTL